MNASIIIIGDEILIGQVTDTNSGWIAKKLNEIGISVSNMITIGDSKEEIIKSLNSLLPVSDFIFITGGLGPTNDDITKKVLSDYFDTKLVLNEDVLNKIKTRLYKLGVEVNENNYNQAMLPEKAKIIQNLQGTAPGMLFEKNEQYVFSMPGVPVEMKYIFENEIIPYLKNNFICNEIIHQTFVFVNIAESILAEKIKNWEENLPDYIKVAYLPSYGYIRLRLSLYNADEKSKKLLKEKIEELKKIVSENIIAEKDVSLEELIGEILKDKGATISTAESCTGGKIASMLTSVPGSSQYFKGSIISYSNDIKSEILNVNEKDIKTYGAVSREVVEQMAENVQKLLKTDYSIATSGIAGPNGGTVEKQVGTVWIAIRIKDKTISKKYLFSNNRTTNIIRASNMGLAMLVKELINDC